MSLNIIFANSNVQRNSAFSVPLRAASYHVDSTLDSFWQLFLVYFLSRASATVSLFTFRLGIPLHVTCKSHCGDKVS